MKKLWHEFEKFIGIYRWHPKIALRYLPIVETIRQLPQSNCDVLEVGSGGLGIAPYLNRPVVGVDTDFQPPLHPLLIPVLGSTLNLPFADRSFSCVVSIDMLEHVDPQHRRKAIYEMLRIAKNRLFVGVPCGRLSEAQDDTLRKLYKTRLKNDFRFLVEQVEYGLPEKREMFDTIFAAAKESGREVTISMRGNINLKFRSFLMHGWISKNILVNVLFRKVFLLFIPLFRLFNQEPTYRQLFFVELKS